MLLGTWLVDRPVDLIRESLRALGRRPARAARSGSSRRDELGELAQELNAVGERVAARERLQHADRLRTIGQLASGVAHELGTPLSVIGVRARLIASGEATGAEAQANAQGHPRPVGAHDGHRPPAAGLRPPAGIADGARRPAPRGDGVARHARSRWRRSTTCASRSTLPEQPLLVRADQTQLQQVVTNLVMNGVQAMARGGRLRVEVGRGAGQHRRSSTPRRPTDWAWVRVSDDGPGHSARAPGARLRAVLHDQARRRGDRARARGGPGHRRGARRLGRRSRASRARGARFTVFLRGGATQAAAARGSRRDRPGPARRRRPRACARRSTRRSAKRGFEVDWRTAAQEALDLLRDDDVDVVVTDLQHARHERARAVRAHRRAAGPTCPSIVITAFGSLETAIAAIRAGAYDFITKPFEIEALVRGAGARRPAPAAARRRCSTLRRVVAESAPLRQPHRARAPAMQRGLRPARRASPTRRPRCSSRARAAPARSSWRARCTSAGRAGPAVRRHQLRGGAGGAARERALRPRARRLHRRPRARAPGSSSRRNGGTLFLDEIGDMPLVAAAEAPARAAGAHACARSAATRRCRSTCASIAATNRDLRALVEEERFREDLYFRINVIHVELPPLRARGGDVLLLAQHFVDLHAARAGKRVTGHRARRRPRSSSPTAGRATCASCRTASSARSRSRARADRGRRPAGDGAGLQRSHVLVASGRSRRSWSRSTEVERRYILRVLEAVGGNKTLAAQILGVDRKTLYRKLEEYGALRGAKDA